MTSDWRGLPIPFFLISIVYIFIFYSFGQVILWYLAYFFINLRHLYSHVCFSWHQHQQYYQQSHINTKTNTLTHRPPTYAVPVNDSNADDDQHEHGHDQSGTWTVSMFTCFCVCVYECGIVRCILFVRWWAGGWIFVSEF